VSISRSILTGLWLALTAYAGPPLTTVQDVLYKADGTRFNGTLIINWTSFQAPDSSAVVTQSTTVKVVDGNLRVQLVPNTTATPANTYSVSYNSDGRVQFRENWAVPSSQRPLRLRDIRVASNSSSTAAPDTLTSVQESDVVGLIADLGSRPLKGSGFAAGRVAMVNSSGMLDAVTGASADCVHVDGTSGPCGDPNSAPAFVDGDSPAGIVDGANANFTLTATPSPASSLAVYRNGLLQKIAQDYTFSGRTVAFVAGAVPQPGDTLLASYRQSGGATGTSQFYPGPQVLCSGTGGSSTATSLASLGSCFIPGGLLAAGDRVEVRFDVEHQGTAAGWSFEADWGGTVALHRDVSVSEARATGRADASIVSDGAGLSTQSWGSSLVFSTGVLKALDAWAAGLTIDFKGTVASAVDSVALRNYTVVRIP
jgi:hypothetical protein